MILRKASKALKELYYLSAQITVDALSKKRQVLRKRGDAVRWKLSLSAGL